MSDAEAKKELLSIIDQLAELTKKQNEIRDQEFELRDRISLIRSKHFVEITMSTNDKGKPTYPNERVRQAALTVALNDDAEYKDLATKLRIMDKVLQDVAVEFTRLSSRKALLLAVAGISNSLSTEAMVSLLSQRKN